MVSTLIFLSRKFKLFLIVAERVDVTDVDHDKESAKIYR